MRQPTNPFHPGEILAEEFLHPEGITQTAFAEKIGWTRARLNELIIAPEQHVVPGAKKGARHVVPLLT